ncbi:hypothetical protein BJV74DRAFT_891526 [Russula compacta]|nr:hypothetical protein BJV74DRAFT_891526 [Russula compacta]
MPRFPCHIGVAFYNIPGFSMQWVLVLSKYRLFEREVCCRTAIETVNGWRESSETCAPSLAALYPTALFCGVVHVAFSSKPMKVLKELISEIKLPPQGGQFLGAELDIPERYVVRIILRLCQAGFFKLPTLDSNSLANLIRGGLPVLLGAQRHPTDDSFPVLRLAKCKPSFGHNHGPL